MGRVTGGTFADLRTAGVHAHGSVKEALVTSVTGQRAIGGATLEAVVAITGEGTGVVFGAASVFYGAHIVSTRLTFFGGAVGGARDTGVDFLAG